MWENNNDLMKFDFIQINYSVKIKYIAFYSFAAAAADVVVVVVIRC